MAYTEKRLVLGSALTNTSADYYTTPDVTTTIVKEIVICNTDVSARTFTMYITPTTATVPAVANTIFNLVTIQPNETKIFGLTEVLPPGYTIKALASANAVVSFAASGIERT